MRSAAFLSIATLASAFPALNDAALNTLQALASASQPEKRQAITFDPAKQFVSTSGQHAWQAPNFAAGDQRGPCPGLNALANHGYLPRNGIAEWTQIATATNSVYGLGNDIAGFLAIYGAIFDGSIISLDPGYSIGGPSPNEQNILGGLGILGTPQGLSGSHNKYESDSSSARYDLYNGGNDYKIDMTRFNALYKLQSGTGDYDLNVWKVHRKNMFIKSVNENPYFFYAPFAGVIASTGGFTFPPRMMSNKSAEHPDNGILDKAVLKSFFSISGPENNLTYTYGHERIPDNFYRRAYGNEYNIPKFWDDFYLFASYFPEMVSTGGNTGKTNSYAALDLGNFTGGIYNGKDFLTNPSSLECFVFQSLLAAAPDVLRGGYADITKPMASLTDAVNTFLGNTTCPQIETLNQGQFKNYPGASTGQTSGIIL